MIYQNSTASSTYSSGLSDLVMLSIAASILYWSTLPLSCLIVVKMHTQSVPRSWSNTGLLVLQAVALVVTSTVISMFLIMPSSPVVPIVSIFATSIGAVLMNRQWAPARVKVAVTALTTLAIYGLMISAFALMQYISYLE